MGKHKLHSWLERTTFTQWFLFRVFYIRTDGDEGNIYIDTHFKVVGNMPSLPRIRESVSVQPRTGDLFLFPSGLMHMVNQT